MTASKDDGMREAIPFDKTDLAQLQQVREEFRNRWRASAWKLLCSTLDDLEARPLLSSSAAASGVVGMREALEAASPMISDHAAGGRRLTKPEDARRVHAMIKAALSSSRSAGGSEGATRAEDGPTAPISTDTKGTTK